MDGTGSNEGLHDMRQGQSAKVDWKDVVRKKCSLQEVDIEKGRDGWAAPPSDLFMVRGPLYFSRRIKVPSAESILKPLGVDWLTSSTRMEHVLAHPENCVRKALNAAHAEGEGLKTFVFAVNLMIPGKDQRSAVFYFATDEPIRPGSLLYRFIHGDDAFRNSRFKFINKVVKGPWIVRATTGNHSACLLGKALTVKYINGPNYLEIDVDMGSSAVANAILHLALGYVTSVAVDMAFVIECQAEEELPEQLLGAVRVAHMEIGGACVMEPVPESASEKIPHGLTPQQSQNSWKRLGRSLSLLTGIGKAGRVEDAEEQEQ